MPAKKKKKRNVRAKTAPDELDGKVNGLLMLKPQMSVREIAKRLNIPLTTAWRRKVKATDPERILEYIHNYDQLIPLAYAVYIKRLVAGDHAAARDIAYGRGVLLHKHDVDLSGKLEIDLMSDSELADELSEIIKAARKK